MNTISIIKRSLVISGAALVIAAPTAQARVLISSNDAFGSALTSKAATASVTGYHLPMQVANARAATAAQVSGSHLPTQVANARAASAAQSSYVASLTPPAPAVTGTIRFSNGGLRDSHPVLPINAAGHSVQWINLAIGGLAVALVFSIMYLAIAGTQPPQTRRRSGTQLPGTPHHQA